MDAKLTGKIISRERKAKGFNQIELAEKLSVSNRTVSKWETGEGFPDITLLPKISAVLEISIDELLTGEKPDRCVDGEDNRLSKKRLENDFKIFLMASFAFAVFSALLGSITEIYNIWAFQSIIFYNHWEIIFCAVSLFTSLLSGVIFIIGLTRLHLVLTKSQIIKKHYAKALALGGILLVFPLFFAARVIGVSRLGAFTFPITLLTAVLALIVLIIIYRHMKKA